MKEELTPWQRMTIAIQASRPLLSSYGGMVRVGHREFLYQWQDTQSLTVWVKTIEVKVCFCGPGIIDYLTVTQDNRIIWTWKPFEITREIRNPEYPRFTHTWNSGGNLTFLRITKSPGVGAEYRIFGGSTQVHTTRFGPWWKRWQVPKTISGECLIIGQDILWKINFPDKEAKVLAISMLVSFAEAIKEREQGGT